jgi:hypothetical protein
LKISTQSIDASHWEWQCEQELHGTPKPLRNLQAPTAN